MQTEKAYSITISSRHLLTTTEDAEFAEEVNLFFRVFRVFRSFFVFLGSGWGPACVLGALCGSKIFLVPVIVKVPISYVVS